MSYHHPITGRELPGEPLGTEQVDRLNSLLATLTPSQALWVSGYLAGLGAGQAPVAVAQPEGSGRATTVTVLYGTETGTARTIAERLAARLTGKGVGARAVDMAGYKTRELRDETHLVLVSATHGEGDPPDPAAGFFEFLSGRKAPRLTGVKFAVLGLGDSSYVHFCKAGIDLDRRLEELGATRIADRVDCDVDWEAPAETWIGAVTASLETLAEAATRPTVPATVAALGLGGASITAAYSKANPYSAEIVGSVRLTGRHSGKDTRHIELAVEEGALAFEPGDSLGIVPENDASTVAAVIDALGVSPEAAVRVGEEDKPLAEALARDFELTLLTPGFLRAYADAAGAEELRALTREENRDALRRFLRENQVADVLAGWPVAGLSAGEFAAMLRRLQPRLYSIASSRNTAPDEVHLTVGVMRRTPGGRARGGAASTYLAERRRPGDRVGVYVQPNTAFRLPDDSGAPIIMVGAGTGVAPFRAFLQEREEAAGRSRSWLFFGERTMREDFLYQQEWLQLLKEGVLTRMDAAFSRDQAQKVYVQDRLRERGREVYGWLEEGAHLYVCGDADGMAPAVHEALVGVVRDEGNVSDEAARARLKALRDERRYQRDVY